MWTWRHFLRKKLDHGPLFLKRIQVLDEAKPSWHPKVFLENIFTSTSLSAIQAVWRSLRMFEQGSIDRLNGPRFWTVQVFDPRILLISIEMLKYTLIPVEQKIYFCSFLWIWRIKWRSRCILIGKILLKFSFAVDWLRLQSKTNWERAWRIARDSQIDNCPSTRVGTQWAGLYFKKSG